MLALVVRISCYIFWITRFKCALSEYGERTCGAANPVAHGLTKTLVARAPSVFARNGLFTNELGRCEILPDSLALVLSPFRLDTRSPHPTESRAPATENSRNLSDW